MKTLRRIFDLDTMAKWLPYMAASMVGVAGTTLYYSRDPFEVVVSCVSAVTLLAVAESIRQRMERRAADVAEYQAWRRNLNYRVAAARLAGFLGGGGVNAEGGPVS